MTDEESRHAPVETLAELFALDGADIMDGYLSTERGNPEPGLNRSRGYHHGWRTRMMDLREIEIPLEHARLTREYVNWVKTHPQEDAKKGAQEIKEFQRRTT